MGSASPVMPSGEPCWDAALATDTLTMAASRATVGAVCSALLCMESALGGIKEMSNVLNNKLPGCWDPRQVARCGHPSKPLSLAFEAGRHWSPRPPPLPSTPISLVSGLGLAGPALLSSALLCSGESDSCYRGRLFTRRISPYTHTHTQWPDSPACLANRLLRPTTNRQGGENELTVSLVRHLHFTLHMRLKTALFRPKITELAEIQWHRLYFFFFFFYTYKASWQKIGQTLCGCGSTENGCWWWARSSEWSPAVALSRDGWRSDYIYNTAHRHTKPCSLPSGFY